MPEPSAYATRRGAVFTHRDLARFVLDLVGYTDERPLHTLRLWEPACGEGDFLLPALERLLASWQRHGLPAEALAPCVRAVEMHALSYTRAREQVLALLQAHGISARAAGKLLRAWFTRGDSLLLRPDAPFDLVVGNPPYVRQERIPAAALEDYRRRYATLADRADLYVAFIEHALRCLAPGGQVGFICADRWMKNRSGARLRQLITRDFHLKCVVELPGTGAFQARVMAYPAVAVIARAAWGSTRVAAPRGLDTSTLATLSAQLRAPRVAAPVRELPTLAGCGGPWLLAPTPQRALVRRLEERFPTLEEAGCRVGIGVATGADRALIAPFACLDVEADRKLPLAMRADLVASQVCWRGLGVVNPFAPEGGLVALAHYPKLARYLEARRAVLAARHIARRMPASWYRTIDRIDAALTGAPKLLIPDIQGAVQVAYDPGLLYPHHNLYCITSTGWDLRALRAVLLSGIARLFVAAYCTRMHGGALRFQAQYLRRIRLPAWDSVPTPLRRALVDAAASPNSSLCDSAVAALYGLTAEEARALEQA